jgi:hypothetical protein
MSESVPVLADVTNPEGETAQVGFVLRQPGLSMIASGDADLIRYEFEGPEMSIGEMTISGPEVPEAFAMDMDFTATGLSGYAEIGSGEMRAFDSVTNIDAMAMLIDFADPTGEEGRVEVRFELQDMMQATNGQIGQLELDMSAAEMIESGLRQTGTATYGPVQYTIAADTPDGAFQIAASAASGTLDMAFDENGINYGGTNLDATMTLSGDMIPFPPLTFSMAESGGRFAIPLVPSDESQGIELVMRLVDLKVDDMLWGMIDPTGVLSRDPATVVLDLSGMVTLTEDFTDPEYVEKPESPPGQIDALNVNELTVSIAGAELTGDGAFTFDNSTPMPTPSGTANLALTGANALMDSLVSMGLLPEDQAMGARMMLGLFARPGDGEDSLVSTIEVKEDGSILANGQRIK